MEDLRHTVRKLQAFRIRGGGKLQRPLELEGKGDDALGALDFPLGEDVAQFLAPVAVIGDKALEALVWGRLQVGQIEDADAGNFSSALDNCVDGLAVAVGQRAGAILREIEEAHAGIVRWRRSPVRPREHGDISREFDHGHNLLTHSSSARPVATTDENRKSAAAAPIR
ncbi:MAG: hypothetical protein ACLQGP_27145, partial [Isosphaeraceae bacterium]